MHHTLRDGSVVDVRPVQRQDADLLADGFARLSAQSRQLRFLNTKPTLTDAELRYFTEVDHHNHEALGALDVDDGRGVGSARFVRHTDDPAATEAAVVVDDAWQGKGLGTVLLRALAERAHAEGAERFTALVAAKNESVLGLVQHIGARVDTIARDSDTVEYEEVSALLTAGQEAGRFRLFDVALMATSIRALLDVALVRVRAGDDPGHLADELVATVVAMTEVAS